MDKLKVEEILKEHLKPFSNPFEPPTKEDWTILEGKIGNSFPAAFKHFMELTSKYNFEGELFNVSSGKTNGDVSLYYVYDDEIKNYNWNPDYIPFLAIGNGDYLCIEKSNPEPPAVYYFYHDVGEFGYYERLEDSFDDWICNIGDWL